MSTLKQWRLERQALRQRLLELDANTTSPLELSEAMKAVWQNRHTSASEKIDGAGIALRALGNIKLEHPSELQDMLKALCNSLKRAKPAS